MNNTSRKCIVTGEITSTDKLIRIVKKKDGLYKVDSDEQGRGAYVTRDPKLANAIKTRKVLNRAFKTQVPNNVYEELLKIIKE